MKKILITGKGSYIGTNFKEFMNQYSNQYMVNELDMMNSTWREYDFSKYDVVFHVAGLAHSTPKEDQRELYYHVNTELAFEVAKKSKDFGVKQFIFMSSIIVYGSGEVGKERIITKNTPLTPDNFYGDSKKQAELKLKTLEDKSFNLVILRPPMIYGKGSKGNYPRLSKLAKNTPIFPKFENLRSILYLENLLVFIKLMIDNNETGIFLPQNDDYISTCDLVDSIAKYHHHKILFISTFNPIIRLMKKNKDINKMFGSLIIDKKISNYKYNYNYYSLEESIRKTEGER